MRHLKKGRSLHRSSSHRKALLCNLAVAVLTNGRVRTTEAKAKEVGGWWIGLLLGASVVICMRAV